jgi:lipid-binding SYLF domain-containing protein
MHWLRYCIVLLSFALMSPSYGQTAEEARLTNAGAVLQRFTSDPETSIPPLLLQYARGIAVIPGAVRMGFIVGGRRGRGVVTVRTNDGSWSNPTFITLTGGSFGLQIGVESMDIVLVFGSEQSVDTIHRGKFTLGSDAAVTAGPVGRAARATTDMTFTSEVYAYADSRGMFAGASLEGTRLSIDTEANLNFYPPGSSAQPLQGQSSSTPAAVRRFLLSLGRAEEATVPPTGQSGDAPTDGAAITYPLGGSEESN